MFYHCLLGLEDARYHSYGDEREEIITYVSTYDMQRQSNKGKPRPKKQSGRRDFILNT